MKDRNFDDLAEKLKTRIYGSPKGRLRIDQVWNDLTEHLLEIEKPEGLTVLDAGGGMGQISLDLARKGHRIVLCDISKKMLREAEDRFSKEKLQDRLTVIHGPLKDIQNHYGPVFDLILCHAVMEWLAHPENAISDLVACLKPGAFLSLLVYNVNALIFQNALKGNFRKIMSRKFAGHERGLTPQNPLAPEQVSTWISDAGLTVRQVTGIRIFYDYMGSSIRKERSYEDILELERTYCHMPPFAWMGKYIHWIAEFR